MKKLLLLLQVALIISSAANAQVNFGIQAAAIGSYITNEYLLFIRDQPTDKTQKSTSNLRYSWKAGAVANIPLSKKISLMTQLNILSKGARHAFLYSYPFDYSLTYLEVPLFVNYHINCFSGHFFIGIGPVLSYGLRGELNDNYANKFPIEFDGKVAPGVHLKPFELGASAIIGYHFNNHLFFNAHYNLGLTNISPALFYSTKNYYAGLGIGYFLKVTK